MTENKKEREEKITFNQELMNYFQDLANAVRENAGEKIIGAIATQLNDLNNYLHDTSMKKLSPPYFEYSKDDLQTMKATRAQIAVLEILLGALTPEYLISEANKAAEEIERLKAGEPLESAY